MFVGRYANSLVFVELDHGEKDVNVFFSCSLAYGAQTKEKRRLNECNR